MFVQVSSRVRVAMPPAAVFALIQREASPGDLWVGWGPILGAVKSRYLPSEGALPLREIEAVDGSIFLERAVQVDPPRSYAYRLLGGLRPPISWLVDEGAGRIELEPAGHDGTQISWVFAWRLRSVVAWPILALLAIPFRRAMERCLWKTRVRLERQALLAP